MTSLDKICFEGTKTAHPAFLLSLEHILTAKAGQW